MRFNQLIRKFSLLTSEILLDCNAIVRSVAAVDYHQVSPKQVPTRTTAKSDFRYSCENQGS
jgi:hypothetical protein